MDKIVRTNVSSAGCVLPEMSGKFDLVFYASQRARAIIAGSPPLVSGFDNPRNYSIIVSLEEISQRKITFDQMLDGLALDSASSNSEPQKRASEGERSFHGLTNDMTIDYKSQEESEDAEDDDF